MDIETLKEVLSLVAPAVFHVVVAVIACVRIARHFKKRKNEQDVVFVEAMKKQQKSFDDIAKIYAKLSSIEKRMSEKGRK